MSHAQIISIVGAKGGIGNSTIALNLAFMLAGLKKEQILLIDFDLAYHGDLASMTGTEWSTLADVVSQKKKKVPPSFLNGYLKHHSAGVSYLQIIDSDTFERDTLTPAYIAETFHFLAQGFPTIVVDCGSILSSAHSPLLLASSDVIMTTTSQLHVIQHAKSKYESLQCGFVPSEKIKFVVNSWSNSKQIPKSLITEKLPIPAAFFLARDDDALHKAYMKAGPAWLHAKKGDFCRSLQEAYNAGLLTKDRGPFPLKEVLQVDGSALIAKWMPTTRTEESGERDAAGPAEINSNKTQKSAQSSTQVSAATKIDDDWVQLKHEILQRLFKVIDLNKMAVKHDRNFKSKLREETNEAILKIINEIGEKKVPQGKRKMLVDEVLNEALGLGPLEELLAQPGITEIMINGKDQIYIEQKGRLTLTGLSFTDNEQLERIIERIVSPIGRRVDESTPLVDARLPDGSRVNIIIPPLALKGPSVTIRRFSETPLRVDDLIEFGALTKDMAEFLSTCIGAKLNLIISGGTGTGKTTLLNVLSSFIPDCDRIITIEDSAELQLRQAHVVTLESRPANIEGKGEIPIRDLVRNALRMRPDRIVVGECRGGEALDMLQAMNTGHDGSMTTIHSNSTRDAIARLETLVLFSGIKLPTRAIREQIGGAINLIVQLSRLKDGSRKITEISEITGMEGDIITMQKLFSFNQTGVDKKGNVQGQFEPSGFIPKFWDRLESHGITISRDIFMPTNAVMQQAG